MAENKETILLVDDLPENLQLLSEILLQYNYIVRRVRSGRMALKTIQIKPPDLIILDIKMPEMDGYEVCQALKANPDWRDIPVIFISALDEVFDKVKAFKCGGVDYITKPFHLEEVLARVENQLTIQRQKKALKDEIIKRQESEAKFAAIFDHSPDPVWISTLPEGRFINVNNRFCQFLGATHAEILNKPCIELGIWSNVEDLYYFQQTLIEQGIIQNFEVKIHTKSGEIRNVLLFAKRENINGETFVIGVVQDITILKLTEKILAEQKRILSTSINNLPGMVYSRLNDENWTMKFVSEGCKLVTGYDSSELQNNQVISYGDLIYPEDKDAVDIKFQQSLETKTPYKNEYRILDNEGKIRWVYEQAQGNYTPDGTLLTIEGFIQDISEQRTAFYERQLAEFALAEAKSAAETATKVQSKFMTDMSYKIRTAMNGVLGMAQLLTTTNLTREQQDFIQTILDSGEEILTITKNIVDCSEVQSEISNLENRVVVLQKFLRSICTQSKNSKRPHIEIDPQMAEKFPLSILLAEDNLVNQKVICQILQKFGYQMDIVNNGTEAVKAVENQAYDLVLMSIEMPEMDGLTATREIRQKLTIQPQIVGMIANVLAEDYYTCLDSGMDDYITKPIKINEMIRILHSQFCPF